MLYQHYFKQRGEETSSAITEDHVAELWLLWERWCISRYERVHESGWWISSERYLIMSLNKECDALFVKIILKNYYLCLNFAIFVRNTYFLDEVIKKYIDSESTNLILWSDGPLHNLNLGTCILTPHFSNCINPTEL